MQLSGLCQQRFGCAPVGLHRRLSRLHKRRQDRVADRGQVLGSSKSLLQKVSPAIPEVESKINALQPKLLETKQNGERLDAQVQALRAKSDALTAEKKSKYDELKKTGAEQDQLVKKVQDEARS